ncbi:MAG: hypothetical protein OEU54_13670 [Gemmatimonadota bacterium]|nr:hypothetical protein [Gemmatimonadota bacterium]
MPGCFVVTTEFRDAADIQSKTLGFDPAIVWVPHPVQNRTPSELERMAEDCMEDVLALIQGGAQARKRGAPGEA